MQQRRKFLKHCTVAVGTALPIVSLVAGKTAWAAGEVELTEDDPFAMAIGYKHVAAEVDTTKFPQRAQPGGENQFCDNCTHFKASADGWGTCAVIPNKLVAQKGWCMLWAAIPS